LRKWSSTIPFSPDVARQIVGDGHALELIGSVLYFRQQKIEHRNFALGGMHVVPGARSASQ
jgi:hypothetical protein